MSLMLAWLCKDSNAYTDHATFSAGEVAWIYLNGTIFSVTAAAVADSILAKLHAKVIANDEWILDGGLGYPFIQGSSEDYLTGGILSANFDSLIISYFTQEMTIIIQSMLRELP